MVRGCAVYGCLSTNHDKDRHFYRFPTGETRCRQWIQATGRPELANKTTQTLANNYFICDLHFQASDRLLKKLKNIAIPTLNLPQQENANPCKLIQTEISKQDAICQTDRVKITRATCQTGKISHSYNIILKAGHSTHNDNKSQGILCTICNNNIVGFRYTCVQCLDVDLCGACEARQAHATHYVLRIPGPRPLEEVSEVLQRVRRELASVLPASAALASDEPEVIVKTEIKEEVPDDPLGGGEEDPNSRPPAPNILVLQNSPACLLAVPNIAPAHDGSSQLTQTTPSTSTNQPPVEQTQTTASNTFFIMLPASYPATATPLTGILQTPTPSSHTLTYAPNTLTYAPNTLTYAPNTLSYAPHTLTYAPHTQTPASNTQTPPSNEHTPSHTQTPSLHTQTPPLHTLTVKSEHDADETSSQASPTPPSQTHTPFSHTLTPPNTQTCVLHTLTVKSEPDADETSSQASPTPPSQTQTSFSHTQTPPNTQTCFPHTLTIKRDPDADETSSQASLSYASLTQTPPSHTQTPPSHTLTVKSEHDADETSLQARPAKEPRLAAAAGDFEVFTHNTTRTHSQKNAPKNLLKTGKSVKKKE